MRALAIGRTRAALQGHRGAMLGLIDQQIDWYHARIGDLRAFALNRTALIAPLTEGAGEAVARPEDDGGAETEIAHFSRLVRDLDGEIAAAGAALIARFDARILDLRACRADLGRATDELLGLDALPAITDEEAILTRRLARMLAPPADGERVASPALSLAARFRALVGRRLPALHAGGEVAR